MMNIICNFQNSSTRHRRLVPVYASCPSYFIPNLITSSCAINNISPRQFLRFANHKKNGLWALLQWYLHKLFLQSHWNRMMTSHFVPFLDKLRKSSLTKNDFPVLACPVMNTLCPLSTASSTSLWSMVNLQGGITHEADLFSSTYTPHPPHKKKYIFKEGASWKARRGGLLTLNMLSGVWFYCIFIPRFTLI